MSLWGKYDAANSIPKFAHYGDPKYTNTNVYGVSVGEARAVGKGVVPGWVYARSGTGGVKTITLTATGRGYGNSNATVTITGANTHQATANATVNANGCIIRIDVTDPGAGYSTAGITIASGNVANATATVQLGGRAGRVEYETLVTLNTVIGDSENTVFAGA